MLETACAGRAARVSPRYFFFFNDTATTEIYTLSLHDALPISVPGKGARTSHAQLDRGRGHQHRRRRQRRSEEHTSELQSPCNLVCRLLLEKKKHEVAPRVALAGATPSRERAAHKVSARDV